MVVELIALLISVTSVSIALHTKYKQRKKNELKQLSNELQNLQRMSEDMIEVLFSPRVHEDNEISLEDMAKEVLTGKHETESDQILIAVLINTTISDNNKIEDPDEILRRYEENEMIFWNFQVGNLDELYTTGRTVHLHAPIEYSSYMYEKISEIDENHSDIISEFDETLLDDFKIILDRIVKQTAIHATEKYSTFHINVEGFENVEEIGTHIFETTFHYDGIEEDIEDLNQELDRIEEFRKTVLQASYS